jgi:Uma2 family endonuclease
MTFAIADEFLPAILSCHPMSDEEFAAFCSQHPDLHFEMTAEGELIVMAPTYSDTGARNSELAAQLGNWARTDRTGIACDSSTGFVLPNGARRSPDASWTLKSRIKKLRNGGQDSFWHLCPDFAIEVRSKNDRMKPLREKMREYIEQGAQLGWLIDPKDRTVEVYRATSEVVKLAGVEKIEGEGPVDGFALDLKYVWDPLAD